jgi:hypothetical protein
MAIAAFARHLPPILGGELGDGFQIKARMSSPFKPQGKWI